MKIFEQFFDKKMWIVLGVTLVVHVLAFFLQHSIFSLFPLFTLFVFTLVLGYRRMDLALALAFFEIFIGGHGHLLDVAVFGFSLSIRMVIFAGVMCAWAFLFLQRKMHLRFSPRRDMPWMLFALAVLVGAVVGFSTNPFHQTFDDFNSYLTLLYALPVMTFDWKPESKRLLLLTFTTGAVWIAVTTLGYLFAFTHLPGMVLRTLYVFVRDARLAEVTILTAPHALSALFPNGAWYFRIFQQSQFIVLAFELVFLTATFFVMREKTDRVPKTVWGIHALMLATIFASLSRSFWIGLIGGGFLVLFGMLFDRISPLVLAKRSFGVLSATLLALFSLWILVIFPLPIRPDFTASPFYQSEESDDRELAVSSRWNLLPPMMEKIAISPLFGLGFGENVTFISDDPRVRAVNPSGEWTTYRFEWGYQDLWLKMGILALVAVTWYFFGIMNATVLRLRLRDEHRWLALGFAAAILALFLTHIFSPYLNHPIGLGFMAFVLPFFPWREERYEQEEIALRTVNPSAAKVSSPQVGITARE